MSEEIKIDEALLLVYTLPTPMTKSRIISEKETVIYAVMPKELQNELYRINGKFDYALMKHVQPIYPAKMFFVKYPLPRHKKELLDLFEGLKQKYREFVKKMLEHKEEIEEGIKEFYSKYGVAGAVEITEDYLNARFQPRITWIPIKFNAPVTYEVITDDEKRAIEREIRERITEAYKRQLHEQVAEFLKSLTEQINRLQEGKMVTKQTIKKIEDLYEEVAVALNFAPEAKAYKETLEFMGKFLAQVEDAHQRYSKIKRSRGLDKAMKTQIINETLTIAKKLTKEKKPIINEVKEIILEEIESKPIRKASDESLKEVIATIQL